MFVFMCIYICLCSNLGLGDWGLAFWGAAEWGAAKEERVLLALLREPSITLYDQSGYAYLFI